MLEAAGGARHLHYTCNFKFAIYTPADIIAKAALWCEWHEAWIYGTTPNLIMPAGMPLPGSLSAPHLPLPSPTMGTIEYSSAPPPVDADWDIFEDVLNEDVDEFAEVDGSETSSFGTSDGTITGEERDDHDF